MGGSVVIFDALRSAWGGGARPRPLVPVTHPYVEVHHDVYPATLPPDEHCRAIEKQHLKQGWNGAFYNVGLDLDGRLWELRGWGWRSIGSHAPRYSDGSPVSASALTVVLFGNYQHTRPTSRQETALEKLRSAVPDRRLRWHSMRAATACPGAHTVPVLQRMNAKPPKPAPHPAPPTPEDDDMVYVLHDATTNEHFLVCEGLGTMRPISDPLPQIHTADGGTNPMGYRKKSVPQARRTHEQLGFRVVAAR